MVQKGTLNDGCGILKNVSGVQKIGCADNTLFLLGGHGVVGR